MSRRLFSVANCITFQPEGFVPVGRFRDCFCDGTPSRGAAYFFNFDPAIAVDLICTQRLVFSPDMLTHCFRIRARLRSTHKYSHLFRQAKNAQNLPKSRLALPTEFCKFSFLRFEHLPHLLRFPLQLRPPVRLLLATRIINGGWPRPISR